MLSLGIISSISARRYETMITKAEKNLCFKFKLYTARFNTIVVGEKYASSVFDLLSCYPTRISLSLVF